MQPVVSKNSQILFPQVLHVLRTVARILDVSWEWGNGGFG
jgi:hypothetical protein